MVNYPVSDPLNAVFAALADPTRRLIVARLARGEALVGELAEPFDMSLPAVSKHLTVLERAGLLERRASGRERRCRLIAEPMKDASAWIEHHRKFWEHQLDLLAGYFGEATGAIEQWPPRKSRSSPRKKSPSRGSSTPRRRASSKPGRTSRK